MHSLMNKYTYSYIALALSSLQGCAAPGSAIGRVSIDGEIYPPPKEELSVRVKLDKHYGLGGIDEYFGKPEDYGHHDIISILNVSRKGIFKGPKVEVLYHMTFWLLPPLGVIPKTPPKPYFFIEFSNKKDEIYLVGEAKDGFDYKVYDIPRNKEIAKEEASWHILSGEYLPIEGEAPNGWRLQLKIDKYDDHLEKDAQTPDAFY